jgi:SAM-dependent methyltransferase
VKRRPPSVGTIQQLVLLHENFLRDDVRNRAFQQALKRRVFPGALVLDLGSGSGIWAISAARLGARVVALEREPLLIPLIERLARENGVGDRVRAMCGDSRRFEAGRDFDLIVSETIGYLGFDEDIVPILSDARTRLLAAEVTSSRNDWRCSRCRCGADDDSYTWARCRFAPSLSARSPCIVRAASLQEISFRSASLRRSQIRCLERSDAEVKLSHLTDLETAGRRSARRAPEPHEQVARLVGLRLDAQLTDFDGRRVRRNCVR